MIRSKQDTVYILGVRINFICIEKILLKVDNWIKSSQKHYVCACPNYSIMMCKTNGDFHKALNEASLVVPDGASVVLVCRLRGYKRAVQLRGADLMLQVCKMSVQKGHSNFFYGGTDDTLKKLTDRLENNFPNIRIAGSYSPPFRALSKQERRDIIDMINSANPDILWVGLGAPKQELWMAEYRKHLNVPVMLGVGAAFDFISGNKREAPRWIQKIKMEWLFRLLSEPKRLWKRNLYHPIFIIKAFMKKAIR